MKKIKVMIAEDFDILRNDVCELINSQPDMEIVGSAATSREIIELERNSDVDIILMDIEMEHIDSGIDAAKEILAFNSSVIIIFLTVHEDDDVLFPALATGAVDYIVKSSKPDELLRHIRDASVGQISLPMRIQEKMRVELLRAKKMEKNLNYFIKKLSTLTPAERELIRYMLQRKTIAQMAELRCVEIITIKSQITGLHKKFGCSRSKEIVEIIEKMELTYIF